MKYTFKQISKIIGVKSTAVAYQVSDKEVVPKEKVGKKYVVDEKYIKELKYRLGLRDVEMISIYTIAKAIKISRETISRSARKLNIEVDKDMSADSVSREDADRIVRFEIEKINNRIKRIKKRTKRDIDRISRLRNILNEGFDIPPEEANNNNNPKNEENYKERKQLRSALLNGSKLTIFPNFFENSGSDLIIKRMKKEGMDFEKIKSSINNYRSDKAKGIVLGKEQFRKIKKIRNRK